MQTLGALVLVLAGFMPASLSDGAWSAASPMLLAVTAQRATLLNDGRVLVTACNATTYGWPVPEAQVYNPSTGAWSLASSMHAGRDADTATLLHDGRVLVVGGIGDRLHSLNSAEMYNPSTNAWTLTAALPQARFSHSAALLPNGKVLITGGIVNGHISRTTLIYDPRAGHWQQGPSTHFFHAGQTSVSLPDHDVLIAGAYGGAPEVFQVEQNRWMPAGSIPLRKYALMETLNDGTVLLATGESARDHDLRSARLYDPDSGQWRHTGAMHVARNAAVGAVLPDGRMLVAGGEQVTVHVLKSTELYDPATHTWTMGAPMQVPRDGATAVTLRDGTVLVCGGSGFGGILASCERYRAGS